MLLGVTYTALFAVTGLLWVFTSHPAEPLKVWRLFLASVSLVGMLNATISHVPLAMYVAAGFSILFLVCLHSALAKFALGAEYCHAFYFWVTTVAVLGSYVIAVFLLHPPTKSVGPLIIVLAGMFFTYTSPGKWMWSKYVELEQQRQSLD